MIVSHTTNNTPSAPQAHEPLAHNLPLKKKGEALKITRHAVRRLRQRKYPFLAPTKCKMLLQELLAGVDKIRRDERGELRINLSKGVAFVVQDNIVVTSIKVGR